MKPAWTTLPLPQRADLGSGRGGSEDLLQRGLIYGAKKMPVIKKANTTIGIRAPLAPVCSQMTPVTTCKVRRANLRRAFLRGGRCGDRRYPVTDDVENLSRVLDTIYGVTTNSTSQLRAAYWRTSPPRSSDSSRRAWRADFPEYLWQ